ncbi:hypothetical protein Misp01_51290 [Microtetraspora sp. NBRC 13810]|uniref:ROK family protein n=1 Tax=Microtetraspora sp. NBRC 13810 TaxID=3030990 RepID=UPI0024A3C4F8|nr:ROK family protein [Microtetraspora sp. NBRC 13810]GLW10000.1 hypothetical protein Misp01_51290 [Microtetraspora sp. NBRC 13810]
MRHDSMRARNLALVLGEVARDGPLTRAALAELTGLTKTTVSKLVGDLLDAGMVRESGAVRDGERGRPGVAVSLSGDRVAALGLEINVDYLSVCVMDLTRTVRLRRAQAVDNRDSLPTDVVRDLRILATEAVDEAATEGLAVCGAVLAVPGAVDPGGLVHNAPNLGWRDVRPAVMLDLPMPVTVDNEANLAALGELWFGSGGPDFLYVSGEIGIGAGLVFGGRVFRGTQGFAGELGHVVVDPDGPACRCGGRGCLERYAGQDALLHATTPDEAPPPDGVPAGRHRPGDAPPDRHRPDRAQPGLPGDAPPDRHRPGRALPGLPGDAAPGRHRPGGGLEELVARLAAGDGRAVAACEQAGHALGIALTSAVNLVDPGTIVLGGIFAPLFPWLSGPTTAALARIRHVVPRLAVSTAGPDAATLGAAAQVIGQIIADPSAHLPRDPAAPAASR